MLEKLKQHLTLVIIVGLLGIFFLLYLVYDTNLFENQKTHTFDEALNKQTQHGMLNTKEHDGEFVNASKADVKKAMQVDGKFHNLKHMDISENVSLSKEEVNHILKGRGILEGEGQAFLEAQDQYEVNVLYLISHAIVETGNGQSELAHGIKDGKDRYYNFFGIGAFDADAVHHGNSYAKEHQWTSPRKAIIGGAAFVRKNFFERKQLSLYQMRWNPQSPGEHQYASDIEWDDHIAQYMDRFYKAYGIKKDHVFKDYYK